MTAPNIAKIGHFAAAFCALIISFASQAQSLPPDFRDRAVNAILQDKGISNFRAQVYTINPISDPSESIGAALYPIAKGLEQLGVLPAPYIRWIPREVDYYTTAGNAWVSSCYLDMYESKAHAGRFFLRSRQCNPTLTAAPAIRG